MKQKYLTFGFKDEYMHMFGITNIGSIFYVNHREQFAVTPKEIIKFERNQILKRYNYHFSIGCCIGAHKMVSFITENKSNLYIFSLKDMSRPLLSNFPLNQTGIFHLLYSPRSNCLITFGSGVRVWQLQIDYQSAVIDPTIQITLRSEFLYETYETVILNQPSFDYQKEIIFLPTSQGIVGFNLDGKQSISMTRLPSKSSTPIGYCQTNGKLLTSDIQEGVCLWDKSGKIKKTYSICSSSIISVNFINTEHALLMNCHGAIFILNLKTGRSYHIYTSPMIPNRLILQLNTSEIDPILVFIFNSRCVYKRIVIPWTLWAKNVLFPKLIRRINKVNEAARILVQTNNSFVKLFSPKNGKPLTSASPQNSATPVFVLYDRGTFISTINDNKSEVLETEKRDELFISMDDGKIYGFDTGFLPCKEVIKIDLKSTLITTCFDSKSDNGSLNMMYAIASPQGEAFLCDYNSFRSKCKVMLGNYNPLNLFFHEKTNSLVVLFKEEIVIIGIKKRSVVSRLDLNCGKITVSHLNGDKIYIGLETGQIVIVEIDENLNIQILNDLSSQVIHGEAVTSFAFSRSFWVSTGKDGTVFFWEYSLNSIAKINLPEPIYACEVINGFRDLVVGTKSELMLIKGKTIFDGEIDEENEIIDNFDRKNDQLFSQILTVVEEEEEIEESLLSQRKKKENDNKKRKWNFKNKWNDYNFNENEQNKLKMEEALNGMSKINEDKKINQNIITEDKKEQLIANDGEEEESENENEENEQNGIRKKRRKLKKKDKIEQNEEPIKTSNKEKEDFLNDLFPKKKFVPPPEPKVSNTSKLSRSEKPKKIRSARPNRRNKPNNDENEKQNEIQKEEELEIKINKILNDKNDQKEIEKDENKENENKEDEDENLVIIDKNYKNRNKHEDIGIQSENPDTIKNTDLNENSAEETTDKNKEAINERRNNEKIEMNDTKLKKESKKPKTTIPIKKPQTIKQNHSNSPQKNETKTHINLSKTSPSIQKLKPNLNIKSSTSPKRPKTPPPLNQPSPRRIHHFISPTSVKKSPQKSSSQTIKNKENQAHSEKDKQIKPIDPSSRLIEPKSDIRNKEKERMQIEANTRLYLCNLPQSNNPLSIVTNIDDPSWHESTDTFCYSKKCQSNDIFEYEETNIHNQHDSSEKSEFDDEEISENDANDKLAEAVGKRCPGLIFTKSPKSINFSGSVVPGAAWMRRKTVGSRLIKSTRPKVFSPIGKIEKSMKIRSSICEKASFERIRLNQNYGKK